MMNTRFNRKTYHAMALLAAVTGLGSPCFVTPGAGAQETGKEQWISLFNGKDLDGWTVKIKGHEVGDNFANTFRVQDGVLKVSYDGYTKFDGKFGHLFYKQPFSNYRMRVEYRFARNACSRSSHAPICGSLFWPYWPSSYVSVCWRRHWLFARRCHPPR